MPRARTTPTTTAAAFQNQGSGCFSGYILPPLAVLIIGSLLAIFAFNLTPQNITVKAAPGKAPVSPLLDSAVGAFFVTQPTPIPIDPNQTFVDQIPAPPVAPPQAALQLTFPDSFVQAAPSASTDTALSAVFTPQVQYWATSIQRWAAAAGLDPNLAAVVMQIESCGDPSATSGSGAIGLFQVMPFHFAASDAPYDADINALRGLDYLRRSLQAANNDARLAFAGYNGGIGVISRAEWTWPAETVRYAYWGSGIYADAITGQTESSRLNEWLTAGGSGLCARANARLGLDN